MSKLCEGRTAIITGAGGGLGRAYAVALAEHGANVMIADINADTAAETVLLCEKIGGQAAFTTADITDYTAAHGIFAETLDRFGDVHVIVNNAGNNRDRMFTSLSEDDWDAVIRVHLKGHFCLSSHAAKYWRGKAKASETISGRIINTSSGAGLAGSVGQSNYVAAKAGILGLTLNQAAELARYGITANAVAPQGRTGMTEKVFAEMMKAPEDGSFDEMDPANVAPLIVYLASESSASVTGHCFESWGGKLSIAQGWKRGEIIDKGARYSAEEIGDVIEKLRADHPVPQRVYGS